MVHVGSLPATGNSVFDISSQAGVLHVLASIRISDISPEDRSELRDLVLLYMNGGQDESVKITLEKKLQSHNITPAPIETKTSGQSVPPKVPKPTIGTFRSAPTFSLRPEVSKASTPKQVTTVDIAPTTPSREVATAPISEEPVQVPVVTSPEIVPKTAEPSLVVAPDPEANIPDDIVRTPPERASTSPESTSVSLGDTTDALTRIREIKTSVNEKVGNPVNLVDINNDVGREYMAALLDAMKTLNTGSSVAPALKRLEDSYAAVLQTIEMHQSSSVPKILTPEATVGVREEAPLPPSASEAQVETPSASASTRTSPAPEPVVQQTPTPATGTLNVTSYEESDTIVPSPVTAPPIINSSPRSVPVSTHFGHGPTSTTSPTHPVVAPVAQPPLQPAPIQKVQDVPTFSSLADLKDVGIPTKEEAIHRNRPLETSPSQADPLFATEVTDGLNTLLSEWNIFKKSGLFGTGPKGADHPLFLKMAPLQIPLILAGRFEGATQEIKQSVTDYMNGWRYEQGIIYEQGETFEHYLRRVIRHILDMQKR